MEKITLNEYLKQGSVVENLKNFVGVTPENTMGLMTPERLAAVAGEPVANSVLVNLEANQIHNFKMYQGGLFIVSQSNAICIASLSVPSLNRGQELTNKNPNISFFAKDNPSTINIYGDETGWHIQNTCDSRRTIVYRIISLATPYN